MDQSSSHTLTRRRLLKLVGASGVVACTSSRPSTHAVAPPIDGGVAAAPATDHTPASPSMITRPIPKSGEAIPVIGLGTWQTFDVGDGDDRAPLLEVVRQFLAAGGRLIDSSPMYGAAEATTGDLLAELGAIGAPFLATKVWTTGKRAGIRQMKESMRRMKAVERDEGPRIDLMQVHNLQDVETHLPVLREWKQAGVIRYLGVTHYAHDQLPAIEKLMREEALDFVQVPYSLADRTVEKRLLPAAIDTATAVIVMTPFESGALFRTVKGRPLPDWAAEIDCDSWGQLFLKFLLGHPAVNTPIPATSNPKHLADNVRAGFGRLPDEAMRKRMVAVLD